MEKGTDLALSTTKAGFLDIKEVLRMESSTGREKFLTLWAKLCLLTGFSREENLNPGRYLTKKDCLPTTEFCKCENKSLTIVGTTLIFFGSSSNQRYGDQRA